LEFIQIKYLTNHIPTLYPLIKCNRLQIIFEWRINMLHEAIYHRPINNYAYAYDKETLHIRLRTKKNDVQHVNLIHGDPYHWENSKWQGSTLSMQKSGSTELFDYWFVAIKPTYRRLRYGFQLQDNNETVFYTEKGFFSELPNDDVGNFYCFPFLHENDVFKAPHWVKDTVWYQIFPERFANGDSNLNPPETLNWGESEPTPSNFFGGDFEGIIQHIDHFVRLGITGIYFTPIFKASSNHKYDTIDYMEIDSQFGDKETFKRLVNTCHQHGIKVMLDAVFNHSGYYFDKWQDVLHYGEQSRYKDWFHLRDGFPLQTEPIPSYDTFAFEKTMPKLNTAHPEVKEYLIEVGRYWIKEFNIDGWRLDVANEIDHTFWRDFRCEMKQEKEDIYILGEVWHDSMPWLLGDQFDATMNYPFTNAVVDFFAKDKINAEQFRHIMTNVMHMYPKNVNEVLFNLLDSHDTPRILTIANNDKEKVALAFVVLLSFPGSPCIYYGDEIGMDGNQDPGCRKCMVWDKDKQDLKMFAHIQRLISLRKSYKAFGSAAEFSFIDTKEPSCVMYVKSDGEEQILFALNNDAKETTIRLPEQLQRTHITDLYADKTFVTDENLTIPAKGFSILRFN
jgi:cyclomaltodextrinase / maltogenic alpha-amylase / neopullulanase